MGMTFEEQCEKYKSQQTVSGRRTQNTLDKMANQMQKVTGQPVKSGTLQPLVDHYTGKITGFIER